MPADAAADRPAVRRIEAADLSSALREGFDDFLARRGDLLFVGIIYPMIGLFAAAIFLGGALIPLFFPVAAGIALLGPLAASGFYELARRRERGHTARWHHFLDFARRPSFEGIQVVGGILVTLFAAWLAVAAALYVALMGPAAPASLGDFLGRLFTTPEGWALIVLGNVAGFAFALAVLAISVVSMPMLVDRNVSARTAIATSIAAYRANQAVLLRWGAIVVLLLVAGSLPAFIGLAVILPWLGYSTWHLYTRLVDRGG